MNRYSPDRALVTYIEALATAAAELNRQVSVVSSIKLAWPIGRRELRWYVAIEPVFLNGGPCCLELVCGRKDHLVFGEGWSWYYYLASETPRRWRKNINPAWMSIHDSVDDLVAALVRDLGFYFDRTYLKPDFLHRKKY